MIKNYLTYIKESNTYSYYNKKIKYKIINYISGTEFKNINVDYLNENYTGWCIVTNELNEYLIYIEKWNSKKNFKYLKNYYNNILHNDSVGNYNISGDIYILYKIEVEGPKYNRKYSELDPFGEENWDE